MDNEKLLKQLSALLESSEKSNALIEAMSKEISNLKEQLETVNQKQDMFASHLNMIYKSKSIEETLDIMSNLGEVGMDVQDCNVYSYDAQENKLFTVNENNEREYTEISPDNPIGAALLKNEIYINNQYDGSPIGDDKKTDGVKNVAQTLTENMRDSDCAFRWGGEEMIVIVNNTDAAAAFNFADRLRGIIEKTPCDIGDGKSINITMSMGVEQFAKNTKNLSANNSQTLPNFLCK